jgi:DNA-binding NtrC family response regulator
MTREELAYLVQFVVEGVYYLDANPTEDTKIFKEFRDRIGTFCHMCYVKSVTDEIIKKIPENPFGTHSDVIKANPTADPKDEKPVEEVKVEDIDESEIGIIDSEKELIRKALTKANGNRKEAAEILGLSERTISRKIKEYDL